MAWGWKSGFLRKFVGGGSGRTTTTTTIPNIPEELIFDILLRLPVKSLLACKCVCKDWYALISTSQFVKKHLNLIIQENNPIFMLQSRASNKLYSISDDLLASSVCEFEDYEIKSEFEDYVIKMDHPFTSKLRHLFLGFSGSCNGIICTRLYHCPTSREFFCLWNPTTGEYKEVPDPPTARKVCIHGFGYDHKTDDYKLVVGVDVPGTGSKGNTLILIYTLVSNSWKIGQSVHYLSFKAKMSGVLVHGNLHWLALVQHEIIALSLDISDESFKELQLPREIQEIYSKDLCLGVLQGCLCLFVGSYENNVESHFEVWEMLDYGIQESWTKSYVIAHDSIMNDQRYLRRVWSDKNGKVLLISGANHLVLHDSNHGNSVQPKINNISFFSAETYFESLVSLNSGTYVEKGLVKATGKSTKTRRRNFRIKMLSIFTWLPRLKACK